LFPHPIHDQTKVDPETGALLMKKGEPWINTITPAVTYIMCCNTDITSLSSETSIKAVIMYVTDYITKQGLKTHVIFEAIKAIFSKNTELITGSLPSKEKGHCIITKIVNLVSSKMELGSPMIYLYLLWNSDHYTNHIFQPFYWQSYVTEARHVWHPDEENPFSDKVALAKKNGKIVSLSPVSDYIYRSSKLEHMSLYEWIQRCQCKKIPKKKVSKERENIEHDDLSADPDVSIISNASDNILENESFKTTGAPNISSLPKNMCAFTEEHLLAASHASYVNFKNVENVVPNFIGATLPRCD